MIKRLYNAIWGGNDQEADDSCDLENKLEQPSKQLAKQEMDGNSSEGSLIQGKI